MIYSEGDAPRHIYFIKEGQVNISKKKHLKLQHKCSDKSKSRILIKCSNNRKIRNSLSSTYDFNLSSTILTANQCFGDTEFSETQRCLRKDTARVTSLEVTLYKLPYERFL